jgi:Reverse transcriptase (RNA-dependent DNA polymerase)
MGNNDTLLQSFISLLDQRFTIKDLGSIHFFLGIEVTSHDQGLLLTQSRYINSILDRAKTLGAKPVATLMTTGQALSRFMGEPIDDAYLYRSIVGALL